MCPARGSVTCQHPGIHAVDTDSHRGAQRRGGASCLPSIRGEQEKRRTIAELTRHRWQVQGRSGNVGSVAQRRRLTRALACQIQRLIGSACNAIFFRRNSCAKQRFRHRGSLLDEEDEPLWLLKTCDTVAWDTLKPSMRSSPWSRGTPQRKFSRAIPATRLRTSLEILGRPPRQRPRDRYPQSADQSSRRQRKTVSG
jgi:hypothetical protein